MPVEKLSVSLPPQLAARIDALAEEAGVSRSALIQEAAARYVASRDAADAETTRRAQVDAALAGFDGVAAAWGADKRSGVQYLDDLRAGAGGGEVADGDSRA
jgi:predicted transcriptional regulator